MSSLSHGGLSLCITEDYRASADMFLKGRDEEDANTARANLALAQYEVGARDEAVKVCMYVYVGR